MLDSLLRIIKRPAGNMRPGRVDVAAAALLVEAARLAEGVTDDQRAAISDAVRDRFMLSPMAAAALVSLAERREEEPYSDWAFADAVKATFDLEEQKKVLRHVHQVASSDGVLSKVETRLLSRLASAISLSGDDLDSIRAEAAPVAKGRRSRG